MAINNNFLLRGFIDETVSHKGKSFTSPDIIGHKQVLDPVTFFRGNYSSDPNEPIDVKRAFNTTYVRAKNLAATGTANKGYVHLFQCGASLFMKPLEWKSYQMVTMSGAKYVEIDSSVNGEVAVGNECFNVSNKYNEGLKIMRDKTEDYCKIMICAGKKQN